MSDLPANPPALECLADYACDTGENPLWHPLEKRLYWTDIPTGRIFRYDPATGAYQQCYQGRPVGGFTIQSDGALLLFMDRGAIARWSEGHITPLLEEIPEERASRFNDVITDPMGRVFCGTMSSEVGKGSLYRLDLDGSLQRVLTGIGCSNGMAFSQDRTRFYYTDSFAHAIYLFDYNADDGAIANQRIFAQFDPSGGFPDGCTLDAQGRLWSAFWDGGCIARLDSQGRIDKRIPVPVPKCASLTFGGDNFSDIYITTAGGHRKQEEAPLAGALFRLRCEASGLPEFFSRIRIPSPSIAPSSHQQSSQASQEKE